MISVRRITALLSVFLFLLLSACGKATLPAETAIAEEEREESVSQGTELQTDTEEGETEAPPTQTESSLPVPPPPVTSRQEAPTHTHSWHLKSHTAPDCERAGSELYLCDCGMADQRKLSPLGHSLPVAASCDKGGICTRCGKTVSAALGHDYIQGVCRRCGDAQSDPIYVLNTKLRFDESASSVMLKLGTPTEILWEGDLMSLVYAEDLATTTVIQTDKNGLWGVLTFDPTARILIGADSFSVAAFPDGKKDPMSDTHYLTVESSRIVSFTDPQTGEGYALWFHYEECNYDYMTDPRIVADFGVQQRLSFYFINALRHRAGLAPFTYSATVEGIAQAYASLLTDPNMAFDHDGKTGDRLENAGIQWSWWGENISHGYVNAFFVCDAYLHSPGHRANLLHKEFSHVGCGFAYSEEGVFGAQVFYRP